MKRSTYFSKLRREISRANKLLQECQEGQGDVAANAAYASFILATIPAKLRTLPEFEAEADPAPASPHATPMPHSAEPDANGSPVVTDETHKGMPRRRGKPEAIGNA